MTYDYELGDGAHSLDQQQELDYHRGYQVVNAAGGSNLVDDNNTADLTIRVAAGDINAGGTTVTCAEQTLDLSGSVDPDNPRKVTVYRDTNGDAQFAAGTPEAAKPSGEVRRQAYAPSPPPLAGTNAVVLATVWLPAGAASVSDADIRDRRLPAELNVAALDRNLDAQGNDISNVGALSTESASIANAPSGDNDALRWQEGVETGVVTADGLDNSGGTDDWGQAANTTVSVSFDSTFTSAPQVILGASRPNSNVIIDEWTMWTSGTSSTGFDVEFYQVAANDRSGVTDAYGVEYVATEGR